MTTGAGVLRFPALLALLIGLALGAAPTAYAGAAPTAYAGAAGGRTDPSPEARWSDQQAVAVAMARVVRDARLTDTGPGGAVRRAGAPAVTEGAGIEGVQRVEGAERSRWEWLLAGRPAVLRAFDPPAQRWLPGHRGIDLAGATGEPVRSVAPGTVSYSGQIAGVGIVSVLHPDGLLSTYQPVLDRIPENTAVGAGDRLGTLAGTGGHCALRTCLHLGARRDQTYLDPLLLLIDWEVSLLPTS